MARLAAWHLLVTACILLGPAQWRNDWPTWRLPSGSLVQAGWAGLGYLAAALLHAIGEMRHANASTGRRLALAAVALAVGFGPLLLLPVALPDLTFSRALFLVGAAIGAGSLGLLALLPAVPPAALAAVAVALVAVAVHGRRLGASDDFTVDTQFYALRVVTQRPAPLDADTLVEGGGLTRLGDDLLLVTGSGRFASLSRGDRDRAWTVRPLPLSSPANADRFARAAPPGTAVHWFRVVDLLAERRGDSVAVLVSHHHWDEAGQCYTLRVSEAIGDRTLTHWSGWRARFDSRPCLPLRRAARGLPFAGSAAGGRMVRLDGRGILLTVGDHQADGLNAPEVLPQDASSDYGKTMLLAADGSARRFTLGHRNPQGLALDTAGRIWSTEHGPRGGDEVNLLTEGANYGWPWRTHGVEYALRTWPRLRAADTAWREPAFAFVPSPGISNLTVARSDRFPAWRGDLLVGTLKVRELLRLRLDGDRIVYVEEIRLGYELRDLEEAADGALVAWTDQGALLTMQPDERDDAGAALAAQCAGCHTLNEGQTGGIGPNLFGLVGRRVATAGGFAYSDALRGLGGRWTPDRLDAFLADPARYAPGTSMAFAGVADSAARRALVQYLRAATRR